MRDLFCEKTVIKKLLLNKEEIPKKQVCVKPYTKEERKGK